MMEAKMEQSTSHKIITSKPRPGDERYFSSTTNITGASDQQSTVRYAPYIEDDHKLLLNQTVKEVTNVIHKSPYANMTAGADADTLFTGGVFPPTVWSMFQHFIADVDVAGTFLGAYNDAVGAGSQVVTEAVKAQSDLLDNELTTRTLPRIKAKMRDIGAVMSSGFIMAEAQLEAQKMLAISEYARDVKLKVMDLAFRGAELNLNWLQRSMDQYARLVALYFQVKFDQISKQSNISSSDALWPITVLDHGRAILASMQGAVNSNVKGTWSQQTTSTPSFMDSLGKMAQVASLIP